MKRIPTLYLCVLALLFAPAAAADPLAGLWKMEDQPGWIEIEFAGGVGAGTVRRNDRAPERVGRARLVAEIVVLVDERRTVGKHLTRDISPGVVA